MQNSQINFTSNIRIANLDTFYNSTIKLPYKNAVKAPWTAEEIIKRRSAYTVLIKSCTAGGIVVKNPKTNKLKVVMLHICPPEEEQKNIDFKVIKAAIAKKIGKNIPVSGLLIGGKKCLPYSNKTFRNLEEIFESFNIPISKFQGMPSSASANIAYHGAKDEWVIFSQLLAKRISENNVLQKLAKYFKKFEIAPNDNIIV